MAETNIGIANIPVSELSGIPANEQLSAESLFLVSVPQKDNRDNISGYISKNVNYSKLAREISSSLDIGGIEGRIAQLSASFEVNETLNYLSDLLSYGPTVISALRENNRGQIVSISGYVLSDAILNILDNVVLPKVNATDSPWVKKSDVTSDVGDSENLVASQKLAWELSNTIITGYVPKNDVVSQFGNDSSKVASQSLVYSLSNEISSNYIHVSQITSDIGSDPSNSYVASQLLVSNLSNCVDENFLKIEDVVNELGNDSLKAASQQLVTQLSATVENNYVKTTGADSFVPKTDLTSELGDSTTKVASQKLATDVSSGCMSEILSHKVVGEEGQVYYLSSNGRPIKQTIMELGVYVCENDNEINEAINTDINLIDVFNTWQRGGTYKGKWFGYDADYEADADVDVEPPSGNYMPGYPTWEYNVAKQSIKQLRNTTDYTFYVSPMSIDRYETLIRCYSTYAKDDDFIGFIAAYAEDSDGKPHTLSFIRTPQYQTSHVNHWSCRIDMGDWSSGILLTADTNDNDDTQRGSWGESKLSYGTLIKVVREQNMISAWTSYFYGRPITESDILLSTAFVIDLDNLSAYAPDSPNQGHTARTETLTNILSTFRGNSKIGFSAQSQQESLYELSTFNIPKLIADTRTNTLSSCYKGELRLESIRASNDIGLGRLAKNLKTNKTFYTIQNGFLKFAQYT